MPMPHRCTHVDDVEIEPITDGDMRFWIISGSERIPFCMRQSTARRVFGETGRVLDAADREQRGLVMQFRTG